MAPHCDSMDGPVVAGARRALEAGDVRLVLVWSHHVYGCLEGPAHEGGGHSHG